MPTLTIDNQSVTVPEGTNVLQAAEKLGIHIPHFCYHEALGSVGSCRLCAVYIEEGPVKGIQMSCMVEAKEGMVVSCLHEGARELRQSVIEWLMTNHPHDCPVCDAGGECKLQEMTLAGEHSQRRYRGEKRTYENQDLGPFIEQEMNRCIQCYRCVRTYRDYCGGNDFGVMGSRNRVYFGRFKEGALESPFSGNIIDVCPTGVFTDKTYRFKSRYWDLQEGPSVCAQCSLGCATVPGARYRELQRVRAGINRQTNGFFICDRGRFHRGEANSPSRPRTPIVKGEKVDWALALQQTKDRIQKSVESLGPRSVAFLGSSTAGLEANYLLRRWALELGCPEENVALECHPRRDGLARLAASMEPEYTCSLEDVRNSDFVLLAGTDPLEEAPMVALAVRQAVQKGAHAAIMDSRPTELPFHASHLPLPKQRLAASLQALRSGDFESLSRQEASFIAGIAERLQHAKRPILVGGEDLGEEGMLALLKTAEAFSTEERPCKAMPLLSGPNSFGAALLHGKTDFDRILDGIAQGEIRVLVCLEADPSGEYPDQGRVHAELHKLKTLILLDSSSSQTARRADILLPVTVTAETDGVFINNEGRMLPFQAVFEPGLPVKQTGKGDHPPREFEKEAPGSMPCQPWSLLASLQGVESGLPEIRREMEKQYPRLEGLASLTPGGEGKRVLGPDQKGGDR